jgi:hypothetical protein
MRCGAAAALPEREGRSNPTQRSECDMPLARYSPECSGATARSRQNAPTFIAFNATSGWETAHLAVSASAPR